jgi:hypothetical protein
MVSKNLPDAGQHEFLDRTPLTAADFASRTSPFGNDYADADIIRLSVFIRSNPNPMLVCNPNGAVIKTNVAAERLSRRLHLDLVELLPPEHSQIVRSCLEGQLKECTVEITASDHTIALTYHPLSSFGIVYLYAIEMTDYRKAEAELLRVASSTLTLAKAAIAQLQQFRQSFTSRTQPQWQPLATTAAGACIPADLFIAMDGCVFSEKGE